MIVKRIDHVERVRWEEALMGAGFNACYVESVNGLVRALWDKGDMTCAFIMRHRGYHPDLSTYDLWLPSEVERALTPTGFPKGYSK